jgi:hypothetical protein
MGGTIFECLQHQSQNNPMSTLANGTCNPIRLSYVPDIII